MRKVGLSYRQAAPRVGVNYRYLWDILHGRRLHAGHAVCERLDAVLGEMESKQMKEAA